MWIRCLTAALLASFTYEGPTKHVPGQAQLVRIQVIVRDSPNLGGDQIQSVTFNNNNIPLQPRDIYGNRGKASFQVPPGKYTLHWVVQKSENTWPRNVINEETVTVDPRDLWLQIEIVGNVVSIR